MSFGAEFLKQTNPSPSFDEQIAAVELAISGLVNSFTQRCGPNKGKIVDPEIAREIECLGRRWRCSARLAMAGSGIEFAFTCLGGSQNVQSSYASPPTSSSVDVRR